MASKFVAQDLEISQLKDRVKLLEDRDGGASVLSSGVQVSIPPAAEVPTVSVPPSTISVPTGSSVVPTASPIFTIATVTTPYTRRKEEGMERDAQRMNEQIARDYEIARIHAKEELQIMKDGLDRNKETVAKYLQEYHQFAAELPIGRKIELISDLVKYQDNYAKVRKYLIQQRKPLSRKQQKEFYMLVLKSHAGWKARHFKGMTLEEIKEKFDLVWKQIEDFIPIEEVYEEDLKNMMQLVPVEEVYVEALQVKHPIIDWEIQTEGQRSYWKIIRLGGSTALVKETLNIRQAASVKEKEL
nr:hypothetical protein [Tanacetum cinerariifolium]